jgi:hypothetical protein
MRLAEYRPCLFRCLYARESYVVPRRHRELLRRRPFPASCRDVSSVAGVYDANAGCRGPMVGLERPALSSAKRRFSEQSLRDIREFVTVAAKPVKLFACFAFWHSLGHSALHSSLAHCCRASAEAVSAHFVPGECGQSDRACLLVTMGRPRRLHLRLSPATSRSDQKRGP